VIGSYAEGKHLDNMRMLEAKRRTGLFDKSFQTPLQVFLLQEEEFDSHLGVVMDLLPKIHFSEATSAQTTNKTIVINILSYAIRHGVFPFLRKQKVAIFTIPSEPENAFSDLVVAANERF
jgi:hypothetical protein